MSTTANDTDRSSTSPNRFFNRVTNTYIHSDSIIETNPTSVPLNDDGQSSTWVDSLIQLDRVLSGSILRLPYDIINIVLLSLGLYYGTKTCSISNALSIISIWILIFSGLKQFFILVFLVRNWSLRHMTFSDERSANRYRQGYIVRALFRFLRFVCICVGIRYAFTSKVSVNNDCEIIRFYLGTVCFNGWLLIFFGPPKPSLPVRRSLFVECFILVLMIIYNSIYFCTVFFAMIKIDESKCIYTRIEDLYFGAPLKSFASIGLILILCNSVNTIIASIINQLFYRLPNLRRVFLHLSSISYLIVYLGILVYIYYYSVGAVLLFQPRSGGSCGIVAPSLYKTLWIWQIIVFFFPSIILLFACLIPCLGITCGVCLIQCLPASLAVPLLEMLQVCLVLNILFILSVQQRVSNAPNTTNPNPNPPASPGTIDALPIVVFGQVSDEFNQTEWSVIKDF
jgi:hypothetical protein